ARIFGVLDLARQVDEEGLQIQRVVEVVSEQLEIQDLAVHIGGFWIEEGGDDRAEHILAEAGFRFFPATHQLGVEARVGVARLLAVDDARPLHADESHGQGRQQPAYRMEENRGFVPKILRWLGHGAPPCYLRRTASLPSLTSATMSTCTGSSYETTSRLADCPLSATVKAHFPAPSTTRWYEPVLSVFCAG